ncbi:hypothetical protein BSKO_03831 [Bryopsis sp. KO-2023]|nr:hypothetical protein BSKO_03831 [Bryopsis sp. KO-2023]
MPDAETSAVQRLSRVGEGLSSLSRVTGDLVFSVRLTSINLHANNISRIDGLDSLIALRELNLSSNCVTSLSGLPVLPNLRVLNLASNRIRNLDGLQKLVKLEKLNLAHNYLTTLSGIDALQGEECSLSALDIRNNGVTSLMEFAVLANFPHLKHLKLSDQCTGSGNPVCRKADCVAALSLVLPQVETIDGRDFRPGLHHTRENFGKQMAAMHLQAFDAQEPPPLVKRQDVQGRPGFGPYPPYCDSQNEVGSSAQPPLLMPPPPKRFPRTEVLLQGFHKRQNEHHGTNPAVLEQNRVPFRVMASPGQIPVLPEVRRNDAQAYQNFGERSSGVMYLEGAEVKEVVVASVAVQADSFSEEVERMGNENRRLKEEVDMLAGELEERRVAESELQQEALEAVKIAEQTSEAEIARVRNLAERDVSKARGQTEAAREHANQLEERAKGLANHLTETQEIIKTRDSLIKRLEEENASLRVSSENLQETWCKRLNAMEAESKASESTLQLDLCKARDQFVITQAALEAQGKDYCALEEELQSTRAAVVGIQAQAMAALSATSNQMEVLQQEVGKLAHQLQESRHREEDLKQEVLKLKSALEASREDHAKSLRQVDEIHENRLRIETRKSRAEGEAQGMSAALAEAKQEKDALQKLTTALEAELKSKLQESGKECELLKNKIESSVAVNLELRNALEATMDRYRKQEAVMKELASVVEQQKTRIQGLVHERQGLLNKVSHCSVKKVEELEREVGTLRKDSIEAEFLREQLARVQELRLDAENQLDGAKKTLRGLEQERGCEVAKLEATIKDLQKEMEAKRCQSEEDKQTLEDAQHGVQVKTTMLDSANETISELKAELREVHEEMEEIRQVCEEKENAVGRREEEAATQLDRLRAEIQSQEKAVEGLETNLSETKEGMSKWEDRARKAEKELSENSGLIAYAEEEINRCKEMYEERQTALVEERDSFQHQALAAEASNEKTLAKLNKARDEIRELDAQAKADRARAQSATESATDLQYENAKLSSKVQEVENEMRALLVGINKEKQKSASAIEQMARLLHDMKDPYK